MALFVAKSALDHRWTGRARDRYVNVLKCTSGTLAKAGPEDVAELERLLRQSDQLTAQVRQAFLDVVQRLGDRIDVDALRSLLEQGRVTEALNFVNAQSVTQGYGPLLDAITAGTVTAARSASALANLTAGAEFSFSQTNPEAIGFLRNYEMNLIRELTSDALASVRAAILDGVNGGRHPFAIARDVRDFIGLTERQTRAVMNYRRALEAGDADALARQLRDRRFDPSVRRAVRGDRALSADQIDSMVERYRQRYLRYRSETIARTEAKRSLGAGNQLLWEQAVASGKVDADQVTKKWTTVGDHKVRSSHVKLNGQVVGLSDSFQSVEGPIRYPGDPNAPGSMTINCRCTPIYRFKLKATEEK